jgi:hypothetical protein
MSGVLVNGDGVENDPAAEFLAREQDELAGLGEDLPDVSGIKLENGTCISTKTRENLCTVSCKNVSPMVNAPYSRISSSFQI